MGNTKFLSLILVYGKILGKLQCLNYKQSFSKMNFLTKYCYYFSENMVVVKGESTQHLKDLHLMAEDLELPSFLVKDAGTSRFGLLYAIF